MTDKLGTEVMLGLNQMEEPKSSIGVFTLPCGYLVPETNELITEVEVREITGREEDMLASTQIPNEGKLTLLIAGCVVRLGAITEKAKLAAIADELLLGDRVFLLFAIRRVSLGNELSVREVCPECKKKHLYVVDLAEELTVKPMPDPMTRVYDYTLLTDKKVRFRVSSGKDERRVARIMKKQRDDALSAMILMRLELLDGEVPTLEKIKSLTMRERHELRDAFNRVEGGVDTALDFTCSECEHEWSKDLDLSAAGFFFPSEESKT
jgi:hypothetical protein